MIFAWPAFVLALMFIAYNLCGSIFEKHFFVKTVFESWFTLVLTGICLNYTVCTHCWKCLVQITSMWRTLCQTYTRTLCRIYISFWSVEKFAFPTDFDMSVCTRHVYIGGNWTSQQIMTLQSICYTLTPVCIHAGLYSYC